jgi:hypothetical protein
MPEWGVCASVGTSIAKLGRINWHMGVNNLAHGVLVNTNSLDNAPFTGALLVLVEVTPKPSVNVMNITFNAKEIRNVIDLA